MNHSKNILGNKLKPCCNDPLTGFFRDGTCRTHPTDYGSHTVCAIMTDEFLEYSKKAGNDLSTPRPEFNFPGLKAGDKWCVCASRWLDAKKDGVIVPIDIEACEESATKIVPIEDLKECAIV